MSFLDTLLQRAQKTEPISTRIDAGFSQNHDAAAALLRAWRTYLQARKLELEQHRQEQP